LCLDEGSLNVDLNERLNLDTYVYRDAEIASPLDPNNRVDTGHHQVLALSGSLLELPLNLYKYSS
jgi:hypothetical protein